jgi:membrane fusion protein, multidrug efflux system
MLSRAVLVASLGLTGVACKKAAPPARPPTEVSVIGIIPRTLSADYEFVGNVQASRRVDVRASVSGVIISRPFTEGAAVKAGSVLYRIDPTTYDAAYRGAKARLAQAQARFANAERMAARLQPLLADNAVAKQDVDDADAELAQAKAAVDDARAAVDETKKNLDDTTVRAELSGRVGRALLEVGARVQGSDNILTTIDVLDPIYVTFQPSSQQLLSWKRDPIASRQVVAGGPLKVKLTLPDGSAFPRTGKLGFIDPVLDPGTGTQQFRAEFGNADHLLIPGQFVRAHLVGLELKEALVVPQRAVLQQLGRQLVYVVGAGDTVRPKPVKATTWTGDLWLIDSGLVSGDRVVVDGVQKIGPGMVVRPVVVSDSAPGGAPLPGPAAPAGVPSR